MLYVFDLDGTLISSYMDNEDRDYHFWQALPGRREKLAELMRAGHSLGLATNQAGVAFGHVTEAEVRKRIAEVLEALGLPAGTPYEVCFGHPNSREAHYRSDAAVRCRKPSGAMIRDLAARLPAAAAYGVMYVGDRPEDEVAAKDAGASFEWAETFFARAPARP